MQRQAIDTAIRIPARKDRECVGRMTALTDKRESITDIDSGIDWRIRPLIREPHPQRVIAARGLNLDPERSTAIRHLCGFLK
jgi:hypothetical protein